MKEMDSIFVQADLKKLQLDAKRVLPKHTVLYKVSSLKLNLINHHLKTIFMLSRIANEC